MKISFGNLVDQLITANLRIWFSEDIKRNPKATNKQIADATRITNVVNGLRHDLIQALDEDRNEAAKGELQKLYKQGSTKMYGTTQPKKRK